MVCQSSSEEVLSRNVKLFVPERLYKVCIEYVSFDYLDCNRELRKLHLNLKLLHTAEGLRWDRNRHMEQLAVSPGAVHR